jgi:hypothetical protein
MCSRTVGADAMVGLVQKERRIVSTIGGQIWVKSTNTFIHRAKFITSKVRVEAQAINTG